MAADVAVPAASSEEAAEVLAQPTPLAAFWAAFRENRGAVFGLVVISTIALIADLRQLHRAAFADRAVSRRGARAADLGRGRHVALRRSAPTATATTCCRG